MAAGQGTRMHSATPKVLHSLVGLPMITHMLRAVRHAGPSKVLVVVPPAPVRQQIVAALGEGVECVEQSAPLGTGHALATALPHVATDARCLLVLSGDVPLVRGETLRTLVERHGQAEAALSLLVAPMDSVQAHDLGWLLRDDASGLPSAIEEARDREVDLSSDKRKQSGVMEANVGVYCVEMEWLRNAIGRLAQHPSGETYVTGLVALARQDGLTVQALAVESPEEALGVNSRSQLAKAEAAMQERLRVHWMNQGVTLEDPATTYLHAGAEMEEDAVIRSNTRLQGCTKIGRGAEIGPNAQLNDTVVAAGCKVGGSMLDGVVMEEGVMVGPYCHLRPGTYLGRDVFVGSHVEIKNSRIGAATHIGHFSYVGDALIGPNVNVGAGTVTCNYDGVSKQVTEIGEGAFIGSDTLLVAPIRVGARAVTGAGAVVTNDVPDGVTVVGIPALPIARRRVSAAEAAGREGG